MKGFSPKIKFLAINIAIAIVLIFILGYIVLSRLDNYTQHGQFIVVPSFSQLTPEEAYQLALQKQLRVQVIDSLYDAEAQPGTILEQSPPAGSPVKENRLIHLIINSNNPEKVVFPNLQNTAYRQTIQTLQARGFQIGRIEYAPSEFKNLVLHLKYKGEIIAPESMLTKGAVIDIVLSSGNGKNTVTVPSFTGKNVREAMEILRKSFLNIGEIIPDASITDKNNIQSAIIYQQEPLRDATVEAGSDMNFHITLQKDRITALDSLTVTE